MNNRLAKIFSYILIAPAILPLVYVSGLVFPYISVKIFLLWGFGIVACSIFVFLAFSGHPFFYQRLRGSFAWIPSALLVVAYSASIFGIDFYHSFWGLFERGDGLLTLTIITAFFYLILISADTLFFERLTKTVAVVAGFVAIIAVLQWVTTMFGGEAWFLPPVSGRIGGTFGNAAFLAGYLGMAFFVILLALRNVSGNWRRMFVGAAALSILAILFTATRGTILALFVSILVVLIYASVKGGEVRRYSRYGFVAVIFLVALFFGFRDQFAQSSFEPIRRIASISFSEGTVSSRLFVWSHILNESLHRPLLGYGAEHVAQLFDKVYNPGLILEQWFDRSHNAFLDYFAQYGIFGLIFYLALIIAFFVSSLRLYRCFPQSFLNPGLLFSLLIITYSLQNFFVFDTPHSLWLLYVLFASLIVQSAEDSVKPFSLNRLPAFMPGLVSGVIFLSFVPVVVLPLYANILLTKGYLLHVIDVNRANAYFERGLALGTYADLEYGYQSYSMYTEHQVTRLSGDNRTAAYNYALSLLTANFKKYPYDARTATYLGHIMDSAPPEIEVNEDFNRQVLVRAIELSPLRAQAWYMLANISLRKSDLLPSNNEMKEMYVREAITVLEKYVKKDISLAVPRYTLATLYFMLDDTVSAKKWADEAYPLYISSDVAAAHPAAKYYLAVEDWFHARRFLADIVAENPSEDTLYDFAKVTYLSGDPEASLRIVEKLREINPALLETDQNFFATITAYEQSRK